MVTMHSPPWRSRWHSESSVLACASKLQQNEHHPNSERVARLTPVQTGALTSVQSAHYALLCTSTGENKTD